jgi:hypothetical protein
MSISTIETVDYVRQLVQTCASESSPCKAFIEALQRCAGSKADGFSGADGIIEGIASSEKLPWIIAAAYSRLRRKENSLPDGTVFTPPWLADEVVAHLLPGLTVVDLGAGSGMLTIAAARKGFRVVAIEESKELATILDSLSRIMRLQGKIELRVCNALSYSRHRKGQIMSNPPFTRHHSIPLQEKRVLTRMASERGIPLQMTSGYYGYFMVYAWTSKWSKRDVLLLPTNWLEARYGGPLRQMLLDRGYEISLVENGYHSPVFDHALTTICLVTTWPVSSGENGCEVKARVNVLRGPNGRNAKKEASADQLAARLSKKLRNLSHSEHKANHLVAEVFRVRRGIATGHNEFFVFTERVAQTLGIKRRELRKIIRRLPANSDSIDVAYLWTPKHEPSEASLGRIAEGEKLGVNERYLCKHRKPWWRVEERTPPAYFLAYMGRGNPRIFENRDGLLNLNNTHGLYIRDQVPIDLARRTAKWLGSKEGLDALSSQARHYYGGLWKLEPRDVECTMLPTSLF